MRLTMIVRPLSSGLIAQRDRLQVPGDGYRYRSSQVSSRRLPLKTLLTIMVTPLT
jgi:hypothetical protein